MRGTAVRLFVLAAVAEAISWLALLAGMAVKYGPPRDELGVQIFGPVHGGLFLAYAGLVLVVAWLGRWRWPTVVVALVCAVPPFATLLFERWARRRGLLAAASGGARPDAVDPSGGDRPLTGSARR